MRDEVVPVDAARDVGWLPVRSSQPVLSTRGGSVLRPWEDSDAAVFLAAYQDPEIRHWHTRQPASEEQVREWFDQYRRNWEQEPGASWAVTRDSDEVLGRIAIGNVNLDDGVSGCAYWVLPASPGAGVASDALVALSAWAFDEAGFYRLYLDHSTRNHASCRVAVKAGSAWRALNAATRSTPTAGTTCTYTPASVETCRPPRTQRPECQKRAPVDRCGGAPGPVRRGIQR